MVQTERERVIKVKAADGTSSYFHATAPAEQWQIADFQEEGLPFIKEEFEAALTKVGRPLKRGQASS